MKAVLRAQEDEERRTEDRKKGITGGDDLADASRRRSTVKLRVNGDTTIKVTTHEQIVRRQRKMRRRKERRHSVTEGVKVKLHVTLLHELRQFYDVSYRVFLVKAQLRTLAANELRLGPYVGRMEKVEREAGWLFGLVDEDDSGLIDSEELR